MTQAELLDLLARAKAEGWKELDLAGKRMEELLAEIVQLSQLSWLSLSRIVVVLGLVGHNIDAGMRDDLGYFLD